MTVQFSAATTKAIAALQKAEKSPAWARASAYVVIAAPDSSRRVVHGKIKVIHPADGMGVLKVFLWDCIGTDLQMGQASGCGYDKLAAALSGLSFDGITLQDHPTDWKETLHAAGYTIIQAL